MNYATTARRPNPVAAIGALGVPTAFGAMLVIGLAVTVTVPPEDEGLTGIFVPAAPIDPPPPPPTPDTNPTNQTQTTAPEQTYTPQPPSGPIQIQTGTIGPITLPPIGDGTGLGPIGPIALPDPVPSFDPILAQPRGNPGNWITTQDYRTSWISRGWEGVAGFSLEIDARGRISDCSITRSTGHNALDAATCRLLTSRARFEPARDASGAAIPGSYSSSVSWTIPE